MIDTIIKGTGDSRAIRSVPNLRTLAPTYDKLLDLLESKDGMPIDLLGLNPLGCEVVGTPLNKRTLLSNETAALYPGLPEDPTVDDVFRLNLSNVSLVSYVGTGTTQKKEIDIGRTPAIVIVTSAPGYPPGIAFFVYPYNFGITFVNEVFRRNGLPATWDGSKLSWQSTDIGLNLDYANQTYYCYIIHGTN